MSAWEEEGKADEWHTPKYIFDAMGYIQFDLDVAAPEAGPRHVPTKSWYSSNSLEQRWYGYVWMNPPFGKRNGLVPWLEKFFFHGDGIALVPDRTSAPWFQQAARQADAILFLSPKVKFEREDGTLGVSPGCGTALLAKGPTAMTHLFNARSLGWLCRGII